MEEGTGRLSKSEDEEVCYEIVLPSNVRDRLIKSHQHDYLNTRGASTTAIDVLTWTRKVQEASILYKNYRLLKNAENKRNRLPQG